MLKKIKVLFLGLVVLTSSACVTPTHASSAPSENTVLITHIQAGGSASAKEELVVLFNYSNEAVNVTNWCLANKQKVDFYCIKPPNDTTDIYLPAQTHAVFVSEEYAAQSPYLQEYFAGVFKVTNLSSGSLVGSGDVVTVHTRGVTQAQQVWTSALPGGKALIRSSTQHEQALVYVNTGSGADWTTGPFLDIPISNLEERERDNVDIPEESVSNYVIITELLPNAIGVDDGKEFIELQNTSSDHSVDLSIYSLHIGSNPEKVYTFPSNTTLLPRETRSFYNDTIKFTLGNATGRVQLYRGNDAVGEEIRYEAPKEGYSWAYIDEVWVYTSQPTPGEINVTVLQLNEEQKTESSQKIVNCAQNQYRSPETNRCRLLPAVKAVAPCAPDQERNPATGRCKKAAQVTALAACKEGQVRSPETNRCRNSMQMTNAMHKVAGVSNESSQGVSWYTWLGIGAGVLAVGSYAVWEWRHELQSMVRRAVGYMKKTK